MDRGAGAGVCRALVVSFVLAASLVQASPSYAAATQTTVALSKVAARLPAGKIWLQVQNGYFCSTTDSRRATGELELIDPGPYQAGLAAAFPAHLPFGAVGSRTDLFDAPSNPAGVDYQIAALINDATVRTCEMTIFTGVTNEAKVSVEWQVYSTAEGKVVARVDTSSSVKFKSGQPDGGEALRRAIADGLDQLAHNPDMLKLLDSKAMPAATDPRPTGTKQVLLTSAKGRSAAEAIGAVVVVSLGASFGSGVLVSTDGYVLTNAHVVGDAKALRVRWSDGRETTGEVVKVHKGRDVALIKTDPRGRDPLAIRSSPVQLGERVLAIGTPLDPKLQNTVTSGVVSAQRIRDGYSFIQSDVGVNHGNSGGPLLDEKGWVIGLTVQGLAPNGDPIGLNFFIPIRDALDFLDLEVPTPPLAPAVQKAAAGR